MTAGLTAELIAALEICLSLLDDEGIDDWNEDVVAIKDVLRRAKEASNA